MSPKKSRGRRTCVYCYFLHTGCPRQTCTFSIRSPIYLCIQASSGIRCHFVWDTLYSSDIKSLSLDSSVPGLFIGCQSNALWFECPPKATPLWQSVVYGMCCVVGAAHNFDLSSAVIQERFIKSNYTSWELLAGDITQKRTIAVTLYILSWGCFMFLKSTAFTSTIIAQNGEKC